jgi:hypothetical protein
MKIIAISIALLTITAVAFAGQEGSGLIGVDLRSDVIRNHCAVPDSRSDLELNRVYVREDGKYLIRLGIEDGRSSRLSRIVRAMREGWLWEGYPGYEGACTCTRTGGTPELRTNDVDVYQQYVFFEYRVFSKANKATVDSATLYMHCCWTWAQSPLEVSCWRSEVGEGGEGDFYLEGCWDKFLPYCNPTEPVPSYEFGTLQDVTTVTAEGEWYTWDVTSAAREFANQAPTTGYLILGGDGQGRYKRFSSSCNSMNPDEKPYVEVVFHF